MTRVRFTFLCKTEQQEARERGRIAREQEERILHELFDEEEETWQSVGEHPPSPWDEWDGCEEWGDR